MTDTVALLADDLQWLRRLARSLVQDNDLADDVAQDTVVEVLRSAEGNTSRPLHRGWLTGIARRVAANRRRRDARRASVENAEPPQPTAASTADTVSLLEQQRQLSDAILTLAPPFRDVVLLRFYDNLPPREIAERLQIPVATVGSRLTRALHKLRRHLDAKHGGDREVWIRALAPCAAAPLQAPATGARVWTAQKISAAAAVAIIATVVTLFALDSRQSNVVTPSSPETVAALPTPQQQTTQVPETPAALASPKRSDLAGTLAQPPYYRFVDHATGAPAAHAEAFVIDGHRWNVASLLVDGLCDPLTQIPKIGTRYRLDADGRLSARALPQFVRILARTEATMAMTWSASMRPATAQIEVAMTPIELVDIEVTDSQGSRMTGVPVSIQVSLEQTGLSMPILLARTGEDGRARMRWFRGLALSAVGDVDAALRAALAVPGAERVSSPLTGDGATIRLVCPPVGSVEVDVRRRGAAVDDNTLAVLSGAGNRHEAALATPHSHPTLTTQNGKATFWPVAIGSPLAAQAILTPNGRRFVALSDGVVDSRTPTSIPLDVGVDLVRLRGRLIDQAGRPYTDHVVTLRADDVQGLAAVESLWTDRSGHFDKAVAVGSATRSSITLRDRQSSNVATLRLSAFTVENGAVDCGDVTITRNARLATGIVVDDDGAPVPNAFVEAAPVRVNATRNAPTAARSASSTTDQSGHFALRGDPVPDGHELLLQVRVSSGNLQAEPIRWSPGDDAVRIVAHRIRGFAGQLRAPENTPLYRLRVQIRPTDRVASTPLTINRSVSVEQDGSFVIPAVQPGTYRLRVLTPAGHALLELSDLAPSTDNPHPRLAQLDVSAKIATASVLVTDTDALPLQGRAIGRTLDGTTHDLGSTDEPLVYSRDALSTIVIDAERAFSKDVGLIEGVTKVQLSRGHAVTIRCTGTTDAPPQRRLLVSVEPANAAPNQSNVATTALHCAPLDEHGEATVRVRSPGPHIVRIVLERITQRPATHELRLSPAPTIEVLPRAQTNRMNIDIDPMALRSAVDALQNELPIPVIR